MRILKVLRHSGCGTTAFRCKCVVRIGGRLLSWAIHCSIPQDNHKVSDISGTGSFRFTASCSSKIETQHVVPTWWDASPLWNGCSCVFDKDFPASMDWEQWTRSLPSPFDIHAHLISFCALKAIRYTSPEMDLVARLVCCSYNKINSWDV